MVGDDHDRIGLAQLRRRELDADALAMIAAAIVVSVLEARDERVVMDNIGGFKHCEAIESPIEGRQILIFSR